MKLFLAAILASAATTVAGLSPENLLARWDMNEPIVAFNASDNMFTLTFANISFENKEHENMQEEFYDVNCKDDGSGFDEHEIRRYFRSPENDDIYPYMEWKDSTVERVERVEILEGTKCYSDKQVEIASEITTDEQCMTLCKDIGTDLLFVTWYDSNLCHCSYGSNSNIEDVIGWPAQNPTLPTPYNGLGALYYITWGDLHLLPDTSATCLKIKSAGDVELKFVMNYTAMSADTKIYEVVGNDPHSCALGAEYELDFEAYFNFTNETGVDLEKIVWKIVNETNDDIITGNLGAATGNPTDANTLNIGNISKLCRGVDYTFVVTETDGGTNLFRDQVIIKGWYNSRDTYDLIFDSTGAKTSKFNATINFPLNPSNPATDISGKDGMGMMKFCVRSALGYDGLKSRKLQTYGNSLAQQITGGFREVNFIESLLTIFFDLEAGFNVTSFNVEPKERIETTAAEDQYTLEAWLCPNVTDMDVKQFTNYEDKEVPKRISNSFLANFTGGAKSYFNQGALISVCVAPDDAAWTDGIRMNGITKFDWIRNDLNTDEQTALTGALNSLSEIKQSAIENGNKASNGLTSYKRDTCEGSQNFCTFASILFADFYISQGAVSGIGNAKLAFKTSRRRLGDPEGRELQNDPGAASPFDVNVPVDLTDTGPGSLKTAGGSSFGIGTFTFTMALLGAAFLA